VHRVRNGAGERARAAGGRGVEPCAATSHTVAAAKALALQRAIGNRATARLLARDDSTTLPPVPNYQLAPPSLIRDRPRRRSIVPGLYMDPNALYARPDPAAPAQPPINLYPRWLFLPPPPPITIAVPQTASSDQSGQPADQQPAVGVQWAWHIVRPAGSPAGPDRSAQISLQQGSVVVQASVNLDTGQVQWMAGAQAQLSTPDLHVLGAAISASAFVQMLGGLTSDRTAVGAFTVQAAAGAQVTVKWGPVTVSAQFGPQITWQQGQNSSVDFTATPQAGPTSAPPAGFLGFRYDF
jgi:hypothetical protein